MKNQSLLVHISNEIRNNLFQYLFLTTIGVFFLTLLNLARGSHRQQFAVLLLFVCFYVFWGVIHHITEKSFRLKIVLEYVLIGAIALFLLELILV